MWKMPNQRYFAIFSDGNEYDSFKIYFQESVTNNEKIAIPKVFILPHIFPRNTIFVYKFSILPVDSVL